MNIVGIDCGLKGAIAWYDGVCGVVYMAKDYKDLFTQVKAIVTKPDTLVYIEKQSMRRDDKFSGKYFGTVKLQINFKQIMMILQVLDVDYIEITPQAWQKKYSLPKKYEEKKRALLREAKKLYPSLKPTLATADALLIMTHGRLMNQYTKK